MMYSIPDPALQDDSIGELLVRAIADAKTVAQSEIALQKARAVATLGEARAGAIMLVAELVTACMTLTAIVVGALLILARALGPVWATLIVVGVLLAATGLLGWLGMNHFKRMFGKTGATA